MNENLNEKFGRGKAIRHSHMPRSVITKPSVTLNLGIREYVKTADQATDPSHWTGFREIPPSSEVFDEGRTQHGTTLELIGNTVVGPYVSKEEYLVRTFQSISFLSVADLGHIPYTSWGLFPLVW